MVIFYFIVYNQKKRVYCASTEIYMVELDELEWVDSNEIDFDTLILVLTYVMLQ